MKKIIAVITIAILALDFLLFFSGKINVWAFWGVIAAAWVIAKVMNKKNN